MARDVGLLLLRVVVGGLLAGHGAQKLFGWFGGHGLTGTGGWLESMGFKPGERWAALAGMGEFAGGALTSLGFMHPIGPLTSLAPMVVATVKAHGGKPIWVTSGGAELPVTNMAVALALVFVGPGRVSLDHLFGIRVPTAVLVLFTAAVAGGSMLSVTNPPELVLEGEPTPPEATQMASAVAG
jgi:putative oxidoreductase